MNTLGCTSQSTELGSETKKPKEQAAETNCCAARLNTASFDSHKAYCHVNTCTHFFGLHCCKCCVDLGRPFELLLPVELKMERRQAHTRTAREGAGR